MDLPAACNTFISKRRICIWLACLFAHLTICTANALPVKNIQFDRIEIANPAGRDIGIGPVNSIAQDPLGFVWFGGEMGLVRYDAHGFVFYHAEKDNPHSLSSSFVRDILVDNDGVMWVATSLGLNRYLAEFDRFEQFYYAPDHNSLPDNTVRALAVDGRNRLFIATLKGLSVLDSARSHFTTYTTDDGLSDNFIRTVFVDREDKVWVGTANGGLNRLDPDTGDIENWRNVPGDQQSLPFDAVETIAQDLDGVIWVGTFGGGIARFNQESGRFSVYRGNPEVAGAVGNNVIRQLWVDRENNVWVAADHAGLAVLDRTTDQFRHFLHNAYDKTSISSNSVRSLFEDRRGDLWVGMFPTGISYINRAKTVFKNLRHNPEDPNSLSHSGVLCLHPGQNGKMWIGTEGGLSSYDTQTQTYRHYRYDPNRPHGLRSNAVVTIEQDFNGDLWIGTWSGGLYRFDVKSETFELFYPDRQTPGSINSPFIWKILLDQQNTLWIGTEAGGLSRYDRESKQFIPYINDPADPNSLSFDYVWTLFNDHQDRLWVGTLNGLNLFDKHSETFKRFTHDPADKNSLSSNRVISLLEDRQHRLWVGTEEGGLNLLLPGSQAFRHFGVRDGLPSPNVTSLIQDRRGYIWISTTAGLASLHPETFEIQVFTDNDGIAGNVHNRDASMLDDQGLLYFGSTEGVTIFDPAELIVESEPPKLVINNLKISNEPVRVGDEHSVLARSISSTKEVTLDYQDSMFSFDFSALSYRAPKLNQYAYKLEGFDQDWNYVGAMRTATYTNIDPGRYVFRVKGSNSNGLWNEDGVSLEVTILPPPWKTWWAYSGYIVALVILFLAIFNFKIKRIELEKERRVNYKLVRLDKLKDSFLANTSHELRTPLNGIVGISESLMDGVYGPISTEVREKLRTIVFSGRRLSALINDILDYSKLKQEKLHLHTQPVNLREAVDLVFALLMPLAQSKKMNLINSISDHQPKIEADGNRLQQILLNLIGNAIKYTTKENGYVRVFAEQENIHWMKISIEDTGIGIPQEDLDLVFEAFNQGELQPPHSREGTGLGLAVSKQLVEIHGGKLSALSQVGIGSTFSFTMPISEKEFSGAPMRLSKQLMTSDTHQIPYQGVSEERLLTVERTAPSQLEIAKPAWSEQCTILIVDDDTVNRVVLLGILSLHHYQVIEAKDGYEALRILKQPNRSVDLVILDIMMPGMDGFEVCKAIRKDYAIHELPVIFLTAKDVESDVKQGFSCGANEFVAKPVSKYQLLPRVENCLTQVRAFDEMREQLKDYMKEALEHECVSAD